MVRGIIVTVLLITGAVFMTAGNTGYPVAGKEYHEKVRDERKSLRSGSGYYAPHRGVSGSFRAGK